MLQIDIPKRELFNDFSLEFITIEKATLQLEHSLVSLSKWEANWGKPFLGKERRTDEESIDYIKCMTITQNVNPKVYENMPDEVFTKVEQYINLPMTATKINDDPRAPRNREVITAEIIYYWMIAHNIPMECQKWHLNRLFTLIRVCNIKNEAANGKKQRGKRSSTADRSALNKARREQYQTKG